MKENIELVGEWEKDLGKVLPEIRSIIFWSLWDIENAITEIIEDIVSGIVSGIFGIFYRIILPK